MPSRPSDLAGDTRVLYPTAASLRHRQPSQRGDQEHEADHEELQSSDTEGGQEQDRNEYPARHPQEEECGPADDPDLTRDSGSPRSAPHYHILAAHPVQGSVVPRMAARGKRFSATSSRAPDCLIRVSATPCWAVAVVTVTEQVIRASVGGFEPIADDALHGSPGQQALAALISAGSGLAPPSHLPERAGFARSRPGVRRDGPCGSAGLWWLELWRDSGLRRRSR